ncbi:MAG: hypothetical protein ACWA41_00310 [Putridiphycobacter sp.]
MKTFALSIAFLLFTFAGIGQSKHGPHYIGVHLGSTTSMGFSYRYWPNRFGIEFTALPRIYTTTSLNEKLTNYKLRNGLSLLFKIKESKIVDLFTYLGTDIFYEREYDYYYSNGMVSSQNLKIENTNVKIGLGLGARFKFLDVMDFNAQLGYGMYRINQPNNFSSNIAGEMGLYYNF